MTLTCPECGCATVPGLTCPCPPVRSPEALAELLERRSEERREAERLTNLIEAEDREERGGEPHYPIDDVVDDDELVEL